MPHRPERLAESIRDELTELIEGELADPRIGLAAITEVHLDPHARLAHIFVAVAGDEQEQLRSLAGLLAARGFLRAQLVSRLQLRHSPELRFELDRSEQSQARIDELLGRARKREATADRRRQAESLESQHTEES
jgi:ribosome-binding factor A